MQEVDFLKFYASQESNKSMLKLEIQKTNDYKRLYLLFLAYHKLYLNWYQRLAKIELNEMDCSEVKQSKEPNPMDLFNDIKSWSEHNFAPELIQKTNFATLYNEICRSKLILEQL